MIGLVSLVGAGPGDPELLTIRAVRRLAQADLVLYDALVSREALAFAPRARRFFVGKRAGRPGIDQEAIHLLMIRWARRGRRVVRLKGGDPFVLGRGGEEMLALAAAGIPVEVVPGVSAATAAPALAGIPLTYRGVASGFLVVSGHAPSAYAPLFGSLAPRSATVVVLMGMAARREIAAHLLRRGWRGATPVALLVAASMPGATVWIGTLEELAAEEITRMDSDGPGTLVIGEVVGLAGSLAQRRENVAVRAAAGGDPVRAHG